MLEQTTPEEAGSQLKPFEGPLPSPLYFKVAIKEARERSKLCDAVSAFLDDYAHTEEAFGKGLVKAGSHSLTQSKTDWPASTNRAWNNICAFTEKLGKQHIGYANCLSQSIARSFTEHSKSSVAELNAIDVKIQGLYNELTKAKSKYDRNHVKYVALMQEAENSIKARDSSVHDYASKGEREAEVYNGFLKRSVTKMKGSMQTMGKFGPADSLRKLDDRCLAQLEEIDICEDSLTTAATVCNAIRNDLLRELSLATTQIEAVEKARLDFMKEGLSRFCLACQGMLDHVELMISEQIEQAAAIDFEAEVADLQLELVQIAKSPEMNDVVDPYLTAAAVIDKLKEGMDAMKTLIQRSISTMNEVSDAGKKFSKNCNRLVDRHGSTSVAATKGNSLSDTAAMLRVGPAIQSAPPFGVLLGSIEGPHVRKGWESSISSVAKFAEAYQTGSEVISEKCCSSADSLQRRIETSKKDMLDTLSVNAKRVDALKKSLTSTSNKLKRVQKELEALRSSTGAAVPPGSSAAHLAGSPPDKGYLSGDEDLRASEDDGHVPTANVPSPTIAAHADPGENPDSTSIKPHKQRSASMLLPSMAALDPLKIGSKLGAAVGFESSSDRKVNRISYLEEEETRLTELESLALVSFENNEDSAVAELGIVTENSKQNVSRDILNIKMVLQILMDCHRLSLEICQKVVLDIRSEYESINTGSDYEHFLSVVKIAASGISDGSSTYALDAHSGGTKASFATFEIPSEEKFVPVANTVVALERLNRTTVVSPTMADDEDQPGQHQTDENNPAAREMHPVVDVEPTASAIRVVRSVSIEGLDDPESSNHGLSSSQNASETNPPSITDDFEQTSKSKKRRSKTKKSASFSTPEVQSAATVDAEILIQDESNTDDISRTMEAANLTVVEAAAPLIPPEKPIDVTEKDVSPQIFPTTSSPARAVFEAVDADTVTPVASPDRGVASSTPVSPSTLTDPIKASPGQKDGKPINPFYAGPAFPTEETCEAVSHTEQVEKTLESFSCALYPKRGMMTHGRISITTKNLTFSGWPECRVEIPLHSISSVEKTNSLMIIPNALLIKVYSGEEYFFGSFMERELCFTLLNSMVEVSKGLQEITAPEDIRLKKELSDSAISKTIKEIDNLSAELSKDDIREQASRDEDMEDEVSSDGRDHDQTGYESLFKRDGVVFMHEQEIPVKSKYVWQHFWQRSAGYSNFLVHQGDKDITFTEWELCKENPAEDLLQLKYQYCRKIDFFHPRTDPMVGFMGPENASAQQIQYLFVNRPWEGSADLTEMKFHSGVIFTVTQFEHIPMADVFKVLQFWSFEPKKGVAAQTSPATIVRMHVGIHYNKYTMLKSKILSGTKDDLVVMVKHWTSYIVDVIKAAPAVKKKTKRRRKSSMRGEQVGAVMAGPQMAELFTETNGKVDKLEGLLKDAMQQQKSDHRSLITAVGVLCVVAGLQFLIILRLWARS